MCKIYINIAVFWISLNYPVQGQGGNMCCNNLASQYAEAGSECNLSSDAIYTFTCDTLAATTSCGCGRGNGCGCGRGNGCGCGRSNGCGCGYGSCSANSCGCGRGNGCGCGRGNGCGCGRSNGCGCGRGNGCGCGRSNGCGCGFGTGCGLGCLLCTTCCGC